ncbi:serine/threonine-protein kinase [Streptomyces sp. NPDC002073]|uniref:serine/threonine-protein kinase n=1 Tax=Streptomyces sp. NBC_00239 TaxID=2903640 RepID=UPI002E2ACA86|nr:serine/threonine-protein kinase [Streptomyces sp. NBC_00239]
MNTSEAGRQLVDGRFELIAPLGSGGMGTVWRARDIALHREVALKEVRPPDPAVAAARPDLAAQLRERAVREARALARLSHPHVVTIHHIVDPADGSHPWIVMELVKGGSLYDRLTQGPLPVTEVRRLGLEVLSALRAAHAQGVQHRDVKPANVLLRADGSAVLTDFGIAALRESTSLTATGDLIGSPEYIAPERVRGEEGNPASDLWSLAMMLYVAAEGTHPLRRATSLATVVAVLDEPIPYPVRSGALAPVLSQVLVRDPAARPDGEQLERLLRAADPHAAPSPAPAAPGHSGATPAYPGAYAPAAPVMPAGPPPGPGHFGPPATVHSLSGTTVLGSSGAPARPRRPRSAALTGLLVAAALTASVIGLVKWLPDGSGSDGRAKGGETTAGSTPSHSARPAVGGPGAATRTPSRPATAGTGREAPGGTLLDPAAIRTVVEAFRKESGSTAFVEMNIYEEYVLASIPTKPGATTYDEWQYRDGTARRTGPGREIDTEHALIDMTKVNWDALPALLERAKKELRVDKPVSTYVIVEPWVFDDTHSSSMRPYLSDAYGRGGYVYAGTDGKVRKVYRF